MTICLVAVRITARKVRLDLTAWRPLIFDYCCVVHRNFFKTFLFLRPSIVYCFDERKSHRSGVIERRSIDMNGVHSEAYSFGYWVVLNKKTHNNTWPTTNKGSKKRRAEASEDDNLPPTKRSLSCVEVAETSPEVCIAASPASVPHTPCESPKKGYYSETSTWSDLRIPTCFLTPSTTHHDKKSSPPLPSLPWADGSDVWSIMCVNDQKSTAQRDPNLMERHPTLQPRMRSILLDWVIEVCEVYKLHRETFYLAMDYYDRFMSTHYDVQKSQLQLVGITCLFIAAKVEEIYPPKISEFAYVTDGACNEEEILKQELIILKGLGWTLNTITPCTWLNIFLQVQSGDWSKPNTFIYPQYGGTVYTRASQLLDLASLDEGSLRFLYSHMAAAALYHIQINLTNSFFQGRETALRVSKLSWEQLEPCVRWIEPFYIFLSTEERPQELLRANIPRIEIKNRSFLKATLPNVVLDETHRIQTHVTDLEMLEIAQSLQLDAITTLDSSPEKTCLLTPPTFTCRSVYTQCDRLTVSADLRFIYKHIFTCYTRFAVEVKKAGVSAEKTLSVPAISRELAAQCVVVCRK
uniref:Cyclin N-terminal domain-containing protein n=1 Tax=Trichogramma kaykai TaxID=54128 RepID=A0ABD2WWJ4_9HYME